ncbi:hypothetical protein KKC08_02575 [Patescibacteria group bacterium]|nr:hypothetical protein [Patescibacteria group bacterium]MBU4390029.1 hypothetical protein [Patescibacteria group bacterium]MBU4397024.1 hypothetical protein [Patescibacteria group bacterium]MBU4578532.1 hypothetical protein [Patescibacteria group bacterium]MCG2702195.1 hypothetical protein [Candidatus Parcubacteria bacterium]
MGKPKKLEIIKTGFRVISLYGATLSKRIGVEITVVRQTRRVNALVSKAQRAGFNVSLTQAHNIPDFHTF